MMVRHAAVLGIVTLVLGTTGWAATEGGSILKEARPVDVVVDNEGPGFTSKGEWNASTRDQGFTGKNYLWHYGKKKSGSLAKAIFTPNLPKAGAYEVFAKWVASKPGDRATNAPYTVSHAAGKSTCHVNLCDLSKAAKWHSLGVYRFEAGNRGNVTLTNQANDTVVADAVRFTYLPGVRIDDGNIIFEDTFASGAGCWAWEGPPKAVVMKRDGAVLLDPRQWEHKGYKAINFWCKKPIGGDWVMEWDIEPLGPKPDEGKSANLLFSFCADYEDPYLDVIEHSAKRTGHYVWLTYSLKTKRYRGKYVQHSVVPPMKNYSITYYRLAKPFKMVVRRNPGFHLLKEVPQAPEDIWARRHKIRIEKRGSTFSFVQGGKKVFEFTDDGKLDQPYDGGYFCIRTWRCAVKIYRVTVTRLGK